MIECSNGVPCRSRIKKLIRPADRSASPSTSASDCSPLVETRAAQMTSASAAEALTSSTVMSLRKVMSGTVVIVLAVIVSSIGAPSPPGSSGPIMPAGADNSGQDAPHVGPSRRELARNDQDQDN